MPTEKFDAYGEELPKAARARRDASGAASVFLGRVGQYLFWLLVVATVSARIMTYPATPVFEVDSATGSKQTITR
jgi:hypothetical protein